MGTEAQNGHFDFHTVTAVSLSIVTGCAVYTHGGTGLETARSTHAWYTSSPALTLFTWPINTGFVAARWLMIHTRTDVTEPGQSI